MGKDRSMIGSSRASKFPETSDTSISRRQNRSDYECRTTARVGRDLGLKKRLSDVFFQMSSKDGEIMTAHHIGRVDPSSSNRSVDPCRIQQNPWANHATDKEWGQCDRKIGKAAFVD